MTLMLRSKLSRYFCRTAEGGEEQLVDGKFKKDEDSVAKIGFLNNLF